MIYRFRIGGMNCSACVSHVENAIRAVPGVTGAEVSLLTASARVCAEDGTSPEHIAQAVHRAGYTAQIIADGEAITLPKEERTPTAPLAVTLTLAALLMLFDMGHMIGWMPEVCKVSVYPLPILCAELCLLIPILIINRRYFLGGIRAMLSLRPNMDSLIALGSGTCLLFGLSVLVRVCLGIGDGELAARATFATSGMILAFVSIGKTLEGRAKDKTASAIRALADLSADTVRVLRGEEEVTVKTEELTVGDTVILRAGDRIGADGTVTEGQISVDESAVTGESLPVYRTVGDTLACGCTVKDGTAKMRATQVGEDTSLSAVIRTVSAAAATKAPIARIADKVGEVFVPVIVGLSLLVFGLWLLISGDLSVALNYGVSVLVVSCPCALGLATPTAMMCAMGKGASMGILVKNAAVLETVAKVRTVALDKTGTVTTGKMTVHGYMTAEGVEKERLFRTAHALEAGSSHPIAEAVKQYTAGFGTLSFDSFSVMPGRGICAKAGRTVYAAGNGAMMEEFDMDLSAFASFRAEGEKAGRSVIYLACSDGMLGAFCVGDTPREDARHAVGQMRALGLSVVMLTGDTEAAAKHIASEVGIERVYASLTPDGKLSWIEKCRAEGPCAMVGDGINDCLPLVGADVGIAMGCGTQVAMESADAVLRSDRTSDAVRLFRLGRLTLRKVKQNLFWAMIYNGICIPLAAGALSFAGIVFSPMIASAAMACSSLCVVCNALTIRAKKI